MPGSRWWRRRWSWWQRAGGGQVGTECGCGGVQMSETTSGGGPEQATGHQRLLALLWSMAMFVLVVDTSLMNVSIASVVRDLGTTVSGVQPAIALEALASAAFILIGGKVGDLMLLASLAGLFNSFRMMRLPDPSPSSTVGTILG